LPSPPLSRKAWIQRNLKSPLGNKPLSAWSDFSRACPKCKQEVRASKTSRIIEYPKYLILTIKRFTSQTVTKRKAKKGSGPRGKGRSKNEETEVIEEVITVKRNDYVDVPNELCFQSMLALGMIYRRISIVVCLLFMIQLIQTRIIKEIQLIRVTISLIRMPMEGGFALTIRSHTKPRWIQMYMTWKLVLKMPISFYSSSKRSVFSK